MLTALAPALLALLAAPQEPAPPLPPDVVARVGDLEVSLAEYQDFLWQRFGRRALAQYVDLLLLREACDEYGLVLMDAELDALIDARILQMRRDMDEERFALELRRASQDLESLRASLRLELEQLMRADLVVRATRVSTDAALHAVFEERHGPGGQRTEVAHVLVMPHFLRAERIRAGTPPAEIDAQEMQQLAREQAAACLRELTSGRPFAELVAEYSHDQVTKDKEGVLPAWRPGLYGPAFTEAVASLEPGAHSGIVESGAGFHIVHVVARTSTRFEDVREGLVAEYLAAEPNWQEREDLLLALRGRRSVQTR